MMYLRCISALTLTMTCWSAAAVDFEKDVWPILENNCIVCHGEDKPEGDLRLDQPDAFVEGDLGFSVLEHNADEMSILLERVQLPDGNEERMPPEGDPLTSVEIGILKDWIEDGASFGDWKGFPAKDPRTPEWVNAELAKLETEATAIPATVEFNRDVRPILSDNCYFCHGFDKNTRKAGLRLDVFEEATKKRKSGSIPFVPNSLGDSNALARVLSTHATDQMPPRGSSKSLTDTEKAILAKWIEQGAEYERHWAYIKPERPDVPKVEHKTQVANPIDNFIIARLEKEGLEPAPTADPRTLLRRLSLDLTGLPPTYEDAERFTKAKSDRAYDQAVASMLNSPHYGERMAQYWLDLVRYADTNGYHSDEYRSVWPYRDYVISAFNQNMPFDQFTIEQIAGDLLPNPTRDQIVATGYNRQNQISSEGGVQPGEYIVKYAADRVRTTSTVWMGATLGCAECHEHKFDPFTDRNFYQFAAFFADVKERGKYEHGKYGYGPFMLLSTPEQDAKIEEYEDDIRELRRELRDVPEDNMEAKEDLEKRLKARENRKKRFESEIPSTLITVSVEPREIRVLPRGNWLDNSGPIVEPAIPESLGELDVEGRATRLDLAEWFVSPENPLTARVFVNRLWKQYFGTGLSKVLDDLGAQGEWPSHPELLDWLAVEFMESGWDIQHMVKLMVTSNTYKQTSRPNPKALELDPYNRLLAYQNRIRLEAEQVRDNALEVSGLLVKDIGGPSVYLYQPESYYDDTYAGVGNQIIYTEDTGDKQYRRGLYAFWRRSFLQPSMLAFDAPPREECTAERTVSNIPQQALVLLNDPTYVEAARSLAEDIIRNGGDSVEDRVTFAYRRVLGRDPSDSELETVSALANDHAKHYTSNPDDAAALLTVGQKEPDPALDPAEVAAWTSVARVLLNLHETITRL